MAGIEILDRRQQRVRETAIMQAAAVFVVLLAVFVAYFSVFQVGIAWHQMVLSLGIVVVAAQVLLWSEKYRIQKIIIALIAIVIAGFVFYEEIYEGRILYVNKYVELYNQYYEDTLPVIAENGSPEASFWVLILLEVLFSILLYTVLHTKKGLVFAVLVMLLPVILTATVGVFPTTWSCFLLLAAGCIYVIVYRTYAAKLPMKEVLGAAVIFGILIMFAWIAKPKILEYKEKNIEKYKEIKNTLIDLQYVRFDWIKGDIFESKDQDGDNATGGIAKGDLEGLEEVRFSGKTEMEVVVTKKPTRSLYLKAYVGTTYTGTSWRKLEAGQFEEVIPILNGESKRRELMNEPFRRVTEGGSNVETQQIRIHLKNASSEFAYTPYFAEITKSDSVYLDAYVSGNGKTSRGYDYYPVEDVSRADLASASRLWSKYERFVEKTYVNDYKGLDRLKSFCSTLDKSSADAVAREIREAFHSELMLRYSTRPGEMPKNMDFVEAFLFEKQVGFCMHFATAATVIYQMCDIPARYVEGYIVSPSDFKLQEDGTYKAIVTDRAAHAWCETFDEEFGWEVREHTISYDGEYTQVEDTPNVNEEPDEDLPPEITTREDPEDILPEEDEQNPQEDNDFQDTPDEEEILDEEEKPIVNQQVKKVLLRGALAVGSFVAILFVVLLQHRLRRNKRLKSFRRKKGNKGILSLYKAIYDMCIFAGLEEGDMKERQRAKRMAEMFKQLSEEEWNWIYECAEQAAFSAKTFSKNEQKEMYRLYSQLRKELIESFDWKRRMWFIYIKAM